MTPVLHFCPFHSLSFIIFIMLHNKFITYQIILLVIILVLIHGKLTNKEKYENLKKNLNSIKKSCGDVCDQSKQENHTSKYWNPIEKVIDCVGLFSNSDIDIDSEFEYPPYKIPKWLVPEYNYGGRVPISYYYRDDSKNENVKLLEDIFGNIHWTTNLTKWIEDEIRSNHFGGPYGHKIVEKIKTFLREHISVYNMNVLVIGSETPWIEVMALMHGAKSVTSVDYGKIQCDDSRILVMTHEKIKEEYLKGNMTKFDIVISFSSLEHSGLGRYGDNLNPWADLIAMAKSWCLTKPSGKALIGFPAGPKDKIVFNSHKVYGPIMLSHIFANWKLDYTDFDLNSYDNNCDWCYQPLFALRKVDSKQ